MIFPKESVAADSESSVGDWLTGKLEDYVEGMLDAVFTENRRWRPLRATRWQRSRTDMECSAPASRRISCPGCRKA